MAASFLWPCNLRVRTSHPSDSQQSFLSGSPLQFFREGHHAVCDMGTLQIGSQGRESRNRSGQNQGRAKASTRVPVEGKGNLSHRNDDGSPLTTLTRPISRFRPLVSGQSFSTLLMPISEPLYPRSRNRTVPKSASMNRIPDFMLRPRMKSMGGLPSKPPCTSSATGNNMRPTSGTPGFWSACRTMENKTSSSLSRKAPVQRGFGQHFCPQLNR